jgi:hypothetical protein
MPNRPFDAATQRHCRAKCAGSIRLAAQCCCVPVNSTLNVRFRRARRAGLGREQAPEARPEPPAENISPQFALMESEKR